MKYTFYTGCMIPVTAPNYELSALNVCNSLHIELERLRAPCCGNPLKVVNRKEAVKMASYILGLASEMDNPLMTLCSACTSSLLEAQKIVDRKFLDHLGFNAGKVQNLKVIHFIRVLHEDIGSDTLKEKIKVSLNLKGAVHYGCHFHRPSSLYNEDPEYPASLDELVEICGIQSIMHRRKSMCCGSPLLGVDFDLSLRLTGLKLREIKDKADLLIITCPGCGFMFDGKQKSAESVIGEPLNIPVLYYSQILGLSLGVPPQKLGVEANRVRVDSLLEKVMP